MSAKKRKYTSPEELCTNLKTACSSFVAAVNTFDEAAAAIQRVVELERENKGLKERVVELERENKGLKIKVDSLNAGCEVLEKEYRKLEDQLAQYVTKHQKLVSNNIELANRLTGVGFYFSNETMSRPWELAETVAGLEKKVSSFKEQLSMAQKQFLFPLLEFFPTQQAFSIAELIPNWNRRRELARCINIQDNTAATKKAALLQALQMLLNTDKVVCCNSDEINKELISTQDAVDFLELLKYTNIKQLCDIIKEGSDEKKWKEAHYKLNNWKFHLAEQQQVSGTSGQQSEGHCDSLRSDYVEAVLELHKANKLNAELQNRCKRAEDALQQQNLVYSSDSKLICMLSDHAEEQGAASVQELLQSWPAFKSSWDKQTIERTKWLQALMQLVSDRKVYCITQETYHKVNNSHASVLQKQDNLREEGIRLLQQLLTTNLSPKVLAGTDLCTQLNRLMFIPSCEMKLAVD